MNCSNRKYDYEKFGNKVNDMSWPNHFPCPFFTFLESIFFALSFLLEDHKNILAVHCLAGKGRTGSVICGILYVSGKFETM